MDRRKTPFPAPRPAIGFLITTAVYLILYSSLRGSRTANPREAIVSAKSAPRRDHVVRPGVIERWRLGWMKNEEDVDQSVVQGKTLLEFSTLPRPLETEAESKEAEQTLLHELEPKLTRPVVFDTVHVIWLGSSQGYHRFQLRHLLSLLSIHRFLNPVTIRFHYGESPVNSTSQYERSYHQWLVEAQRRISNLEIVQHEEWKRMDVDKIVDEFIAALDHPAVVMTPTVVISNSTVVPRLMALSAASTSCWMDPTERLFILDSTCLVSHRKYMRFCVKDYQCREITTEPGMTHQFVSLNAGPLVIALDLQSDMTLQEHFYSDSQLSTLVRLLYYGRSDPIRKPARSDHAVVPPLGHFIWFGALNLTLPQMASIRSAFTVLGLTNVILHGSQNPTGPFWEKLKQEFQDRLQYHYRPRPSSVWGSQLKSHQYMSNVVRLMVLQHYGGFYMDFDAIGTRSLEPLMHFDAVIGTDWWTEGVPGVNTAVMLAKPNSEFVKEVLESYRGLSDPSGNYYCCILPMKIVEKRPETVLVLDSLVYQTGGVMFEAEVLNRTTGAWRQNYVYHFFSPEPEQVLKGPLTEETTSRMNSTFGDVLRNALI